jgi:2,4-dienoyl-CoA reductase (NADPH2)
VAVDQVLVGAVADEPGTAVVYDEADGFWPAYSAAEALAGRGWQVTFVTALTALAPRIPAESVGPLLRRLGDAGVTLEVAHRVVLPDDPGAPLVVRPLFGSGDRVTEADLLVWHQPRIGDDVLLRATPADATLTAIGDCVTPRRISHAIAEGYRAGASV